MSEHNHKVEIVTLERVRYCGPIVIACHSRQTTESAHKTDITISHGLAKALHAELGEVLEALAEGERVSAARRASA
jgi:hypothetical protein